MSMSSKTTPYKSSLESFLPLNSLLQELAKLLGSLKNEDLLDLGHTTDRQVLKKHLPSLVPA